MLFKYDYIIALFSLTGALVFCILVCDVPRTAPVMASAE